MTIEFTPWPAALAQRYRAEGYWLDLPLTDILTRQAENPAIAVIDKERHISYQALATLSDNLAAAIQASGARPGDTALVQLDNCVELYIAFFALLKAGVAPVNALYSHRRHELDAYVEQLTPSVIIADRHHPLFRDDGYIQLLRQQLPHLKLLALNNESDAALSLNALMAQASGDFTPQPTPADQVAFFNLSGGSTGTPKLIPRTHNDYYYSIRASNAVCQLTAATRYLCAIPAAHNFPMSSPGALGVLLAGGQVVLAPDPSVTSCFPLIEQHQVNMAALVPPAAALWHQHVQQHGNHAVQSLELLQVGGARLSPTLARSLIDTLGCQLQQVFGMAEGLVNYTRLDDDQERIVSTQGAPMSPADEVWVADPEGNPLPENEIGLLMTRGPYTFRGYYRSPEHNRQSFDAHGFYCSGDLVSMDGNGYLTVHGRQKDQINRGGEKVATEEIENLLLRHPAVIEAAVVAVQDELLGEKNCAWVLLQTPVSSVQLRRFLREQEIAEYKIPDRFEAIDAMPLTAVGKVDKKALRAQLASTLTSH